MTTGMQMPSPNLERLLDNELSVPARAGYVALLLAALAMTIVVSSLWLTEPALPGRTRLAFALMTAIGASWVAFAGRVLTTRRVLLATHRLMASRMAVTFSAIFTSVALALGLVDREPAAYAAAAMGVALLAVAVALLVRARRAFAQLTARRDALERELGRPRR